MKDTPHIIVLSLLIFISVFMLVRFGWSDLLVLIRRQRSWYDRVLNQQLLLDIPSSVAVGFAGAFIILTGLIAAILVGGVVWFVIGATVGVFVPQLIVKHLEQRRRQRIEEQLVDGITMLASGVRAGLNLVQAMEMLVNNAAPPIKQEFAQLLREYQMGLDLNRAMQNAANRIGSRNYRLLFTAIEMHRLRGGDTAESLDRIAASIREIQRLEGKLDALTAQGRFQANMMAVMPVVFIVMLSAMMPDDVGRLFTEPIGRVMLLFIVALIATGYFWIRRIMAVDI